MYIELTHNESKVLINMDAVAFIEPNTVGAAIHIGKRILCVDDSYEEVKSILLRQNEIINPIKLTK